MDPLDYPFRIPAKEYLWRAGEERAIEEWDGQDLETRHKVLAIGSNASPDQLRDKFLKRRELPARFREPESPDGNIPVWIVTAYDVDVVYGAHISQKGYIPVTLAPVPNAVVTVWLTLLTDAQSRQMDNTEGLRSGTYKKCRVERVTHRGKALDEVDCYFLTKGPARVMGGQVGMNLPYSCSTVPRRASQRGLWDLLASEGRDVLPSEGRDGPALLERCSEHDETREAVLGLLRTGLVG